MPWKNTNRAAETTWITLLSLDQLQEAFDKAGALKMETLAFWKAGRSEAEALAIQIDNVFRETYGAELESGVTRLQAIENMVKVLNTADKAVSDLASAADTSYRFFQERDKE